VRSTSKATLSVITLGILAGSFQAGLATQTAKQNLAESLTASGQSGTTSGTAVDDGSTTQATGTAGTTDSSSTTSTSDSTSSTATGSASSGASSTAPKSTATTAPAPVATTPANQNSSSNSNSGSSGSKTATGDAIYYRYGTIQVEVVKTGKSITSINLLQATARGRQYEAVPPMLVTAAISAQGTGFANVSGATFTSEAFRSALESALAKL
jgi:uncharacterized protein with FMN-binding domain